MTEEFHDFEWEERDDSVPLKVHVMAGSIAGIAEHTACLPVDNMKTHVQKTGASMRQVFRTLRNSGYQNFYQGFNIISLGCIPSHALYFSSYEITKKYFTRENTIDIFGNALVGGIAVIFHDLIMTPCELIKQRMQLLKTKSTLETLRDAKQQFGYRGLWRSFPVNFLQNLPHSMITVSANETFKTYYRRWFGEHSMASYFLCGSMAGSVSALVTSPLDNIKTQLNCESLEHHSLNKLREQMSKNVRNVGVSRSYFSKASQKMYCICSSALNNSKYLSSENMPRALCAGRKIIRESGFRGFFRGLGLRIIMQSFSTAISWTVYEFFKKQLSISRLR